MSKTTLAAIIIMMNVFLTAFLLRCTNSNRQPQQPAQVREIKIGEEGLFGRKDFEIVVIDSCQYIAYRLTTYQGLLTHKGNCNNPVHSRK